MRMRCPTILTLSLALAACGDDGGAGNGETGSETADTGTGTDMADEVGTSDASTSTTSEDSTTTTTTTTDTDADADAGCPVGSENCPCTQGGGCDPGLECIDGLCTPPAPDTSGPDTTGPDTSTTDPTTDGGGACNMDVSFEIMAVDATAAATSRVYAAPLPTSPTRTRSAICGSQAPTSRSLPALQLGVPAARSSLTA